MNSKKPKSNSNLMNSLISKNFSICGHFYSSKVTFTLSMAKISASSNTPIHWVNQATKKTNMRFWCTLMLRLWSWTGLCIGRTKLMMTQNLLQIVHLKLKMMQRTRRMTCSTHLHFMHHSLWLQESSLLKTWTSTESIAKRPHKLNKTRLTTTSKE